MVTGRLTRCLRCALEHFSNFTQNIHFFISYRRPRYHLRNLFDFLVQESCAVCFLFTVALRAKWFFPQHLSFAHPEAPQAPLTSSHPTYYSTSPEDPVHCDVCLVESVAGNKFVRIDLLSSLHR